MRKTYKIANTYLRFDEKLHGWTHESDLFLVLLESDITDFLSKVYFKANGEKFLIFKSSPYTKAFNAINAASDFIEDVMFDGENFTKKLEVTFVEY